LFKTIFSRNTTEEKRGESQLNPRGLILIDGNETGEAARKKNQGNKVGNAKYFPQVLQDIKTLKWPCAWQWGGLA